MNPYTHKALRSLGLGQIITGFALAFLITVPASAQKTNSQSTTPTKSEDWKAVQDALGRKGDLLPGNVIRINMPRKDLHVTVGGTEIKPSLALGAWAAFHRVGKEAMVMGDLVLTEDEVAPVMKTLQQGGVEVTALHNHLLRESPKIMYIHMGGHGDPLKMAQTIRAAVSLTKTPPPGGPAATEPEDPGFDKQQVEKILGHQGKVSGGVLHFNVPRAEKLTEEGLDTPPSMGAGTSLNFQPTGNGRAAIAGDLALTWKEVGPVMTVLQDSGIEAVALHSHALNDVPRLFYMHFWANEDAVKLAKGLRAALDKTASAPSK